MKRTIKNDKTLKRLHQQIVRDNDAILMMNHIKCDLEDSIRYLTTHSNNLNILRSEMFELGKIYSKLYWKTFPVDITAKQLKEYYLQVTKIQDKYDGRRDA